MPMDVSIDIPEELRSKCGPNLHWDFYQVDVLLKNGTVIKNLSVRSSSVITPINGEAGDKYNFCSKEISNIRPAKLLARLQSLLFGWK